VARQWLGTLDGSFAAVATLIEAKDVPEALRALAAHTDTLYDLLADYAALVGVDLPVRDSELDFASEPEILRATVEVWAALNPLAVGLADERDEPDEWAISGVYDFIAREFGWGRDYVDNVLSDEQLVAYLDAATERLESQQEAEWATAVESVRVGTIFAHDGSSTAAGAPGRPTGRRAAAGSPAQPSSAP
jgi:hypothetical protein